MTPNNQDFDQDLRDRFAALRRHEEALAPRFTARPASSSEPFRPRLPAALLASAACLLAIAAAGLWLRPTSHWQQPQPGKPVASVADWRPATDFLLETPGRELLRTVPLIGALQNGLIYPMPSPMPTRMPASTPHRNRRQAEKPVLP